MGVDGDRVDGNKRAVALRYHDETDAAPRVVATGRGAMAQRIIEVARLHGVEVWEDADLVELLSSLRVDHYVPERLFVAVAEVMAYVYRVNGRAEEAKRRFQSR